jgi:DNA-binding CsgD family transcriptional regulator
MAAGQILLTTALYVCRKISVGACVGAERRSRDIVFAFHERCEITSNLDKLASLLFEAADMLGFRYAACGAHVDHASPPEGAFVWHNYPDQWIERWKRRHYRRLDPVLRHAETVKDAFSWDDPAFLAPLSERQRRILNEARMFRLAHGYTIPLSHDAYFPASCSFVSESGDLDPHALTIARRIIAPLYGRAMLLAQRGAAPGSERLSRRERECLKFKAEGADDIEVAVMLEISVSTMRRHIERAKQRLAAKSREHAIALAIQTRQVA